MVNITEKIKEWVLLDVGGWMGTKRLTCFPRIEDEMKRTQSKVPLTSSPFSIFSRERIEVERTEKGVLSGARP